jgi:hypothetical protein
VADSPVPEPVTHEQLAALEAEVAALLKKSDPHLRLLAIECPDAPDGLKWKVLDTGTGRPVYTHMTEHGTLLPLSPSIVRGVELLRPENRHLRLHDAEQANARHVARLRADADRQMAAIVHQHVQLAARRGHRARPTLARIVSRPVRRGRGTRPASRRAGRRLSAQRSGGREPSDPPVAARRQAWRAQGVSA